MSKSTSKATSSAKKGRNKARAADPFDSSAGEDDRSGNFVEAIEVEDEAGGNDGDEGEEEEPEATIPPALLTRLLHEFFEKDATRLTRDANSAAAKYMDIFVREAIARCAQEREGGFLEVGAGYGCVEALANGQFRLKILRRLLHSS
jgi:solute carrier family 25 (adenine nucleotide translocator) protein 4/5/6/31